MGIEGDHLFGGATDFRFTENMGYLAAIGGGWGRSRFETAGNHGATGQESPEAVPIARIAHSERRISEL